MTTILTTIALTLVIMFMIREAFWRDLSIVLTALSRLLLYLAHIASGLHTARVVSRSALRQEILSWRRFSDDLTRV